MRKEDLKIVFFGTPEFAVESLKRLVDGGYNVAAVVTIPDKPAGRGRQLQQSDVKRFAVERGLPVLQPVSLKDEAFINELRALQAQLFIVIAFRMLPEAVWQMPPLGTFNLHASLLPRYRGAAPINWAVMNGDKETGVTTFFLKHEIDTGDVIQQRSCPIGRHDNVEVVFLEQAVNPFLVGQVTLDEAECMLRMLRRLRRNLPQPVLLQRRVVIVVEIVQPDNPERLLALQQPQGQIRPDEPGCAGDEKGFSI